MPEKLKYLIRKWYWVLIKKHFVKVPPLEKHLSDGIVLGDK